MLKFLQGIDDLSDEMRVCLFLLTGLWTFSVVVLTASISHGIIDSLQSQHAICSTTQEDNQ